MPIISATIAAIAGAFAIAFDHVGSWIRWAVDVYRDTIPKPVKILFFIALFAISTILLPLIWQMMGFHCDTNNNLWQLPITVPLTNYKLIKLSYEMEEFKVIQEGDFTYESIPEACLNGTHYTAYCTNCTSAGPLFDKRCISDGYRLDESGSSYGLWGWGASWDSCLAEGGCAPKQGHYFDISEMIFKSHQYNYTIEEIQQNMEDELMKTPGISEQIIVPTTLSEKFKCGKEGDEFNCNLAKLKCKNYKPRLFLFYTLMIFDLQLWMAVLLLWALLSIKSMIGR